MKEGHDGQLFDLIPKYCDKGFFVTVAALIKPIAADRLGESVPRVSTPDISRASFHGIWLIGIRLEI